MSYANVPPPPPQPPVSLPPPQPAAPDRRGGSGCSWLLLGAGGCLLLLLLPVAVLLLTGTASLNSILSGFQRMVNPPLTLTLRDSVLERIQSLSQLTTVRYNYSTVVIAEREMPPALALLYGERQVMVAVGHLNAGIDLSQLAPDAIRTDGQTLIIQLPPPQLQDCFLNESASYVMTRDTAIFSRGAPDLDSESRRYAVQQFRDMALRDGILEEVAVQTQEVVATLVQALNPDPDTQVQITFAPAPAEPVLPLSCR